ncbi:hypothetical protein ACOSQ3_016614 [Xanthoceras sorbifolium]
MSGPTVMVGPTVFPSSSRGFSTVAKEYLDLAPMLYEEFLTGGLSQRIEEDEDPNLCHTIICHALLDNDAEKRVLRDELAKME